MDTFRILWDRSWSYDVIYGIFSLQLVENIIKLLYKLCIFRAIFPRCNAAPRGPGPHHYRGFTITLGKTPLDEWSARRRDISSDNTQHPQERETTMPTAGFEPAIPASERPQTHTSDRTATGIEFHSMHTLYTVRNVLATKRCTGK